MTQMVCIFHDMLVRNGLPLLKACLGETPQAKAEEAPRPPAESKCLKWKVNVQYVKAKKTVDKLDRKFVYSP